MIPETCWQCGKSTANGWVLTVCCLEHLRQYRVCQPCRLAYWAGMDIECACGTVLMDWATKQDVEKEWLKSY